MLEFAGLQRLLGVAGFAAILRGWVGKPSLFFQAFVNDPYSFSDNIGLCHAGYLATLFQHAHIFIGHADAGFVLFGVGSRPSGFWRHAFHLSFVSP